jgi:hypothetical protein
MVIEYSWGPRYRAKLEVREINFNKKLNFNDATKACKDLGEGWRLPDCIEFLMMHRLLANNGLGNFIMFGEYWVNEKSWITEKCLISEHYYNLTGKGDFIQKEFTRYTLNELYVKAVRTIL